jgi:hypothetical protein
MTVKEHKFGKRLDSRFTVHHKQPRGDKLDNRQRQICGVDHAYAAALQQRVSDSNRWAAFMARQTWYGSDNLCKRCGSHKRRVYNRECWTCRTNSRADNWQRILAGQMHISKRSRDGHLAILDAKRREKGGEFEEHAVGDWTARQYPMGRLAVSCPSAVVQGSATDTHPPTLAFDCPDLSKADPRLVHWLAERNPDFLLLLRWASWA